MKALPTLAVCLAMTVAAGCGTENAAIANNAAAAPEAAATNGAAVANAAIAAQAAPARTADLASARAFVDSLYVPYTHDAMPGVGSVYTPELEAAIARQSDDETGLGFDPFCRCQDFGEFTYTIESAAPTAEGASVRVAFRNFGEPHTVTIQLRANGDSWLIADIIEGNDSLLRGG